MNKLRDALTEPDDDPRVVERGAFALFGVLLGLAVGLEGEHDGAEVLVDGAEVVVLVAEEVGAVTPGRLLGLETALQVAGELEPPAPRPAQLLVTGGRRGGARELSRPRVHPPPAERGQHHHGVRRRLLQRLGSDCNSVSIFYTQSNNVKIHPILQMAILNGIVPFAADSLRSFCSPSLDPRRRSAPSAAAWPAGRIAGRPAARTAAGRSARTSPTWSAVAGRKKKRVERRIAAPGVCLRSIALRQKNHTQRGKGCHCGFDLIESGCGS